MTTRLYAYRSQLFFLKLAALVVLLLLPSALLAQATVSTGSVNGTVTDPSGAAVPGARLRLREPIPALVSM